MIIVHENKEILTHNSRRFLVVCNFPPETYTLKASVEVPQHLIKRKKQPGDVVPVNRIRQQDQNSNDPNHINVYEPSEPYNPKANNVHDSRILALHQEHKMLSNVSQSGRRKLPSFNHCPSVPTTISSLISMMQGAISILKPRLLNHQILFNFIQFYLQNNWMRLSALRSSWRVCSAASF